MNYITIKGYEGLYEISDKGVVRSLDRFVIGSDKTRYPKKGRVLKPAPHKDVRYSHVSLWKNNKGSSFYVHRLVAENWIPNPNNYPEVNHKDGNVYNNSVQNLEWCTSSQNSVHAVQSGLRTYTNRLTKQEFIECLLLVINGASYESLTEHVPYKVPFLSVKLRKIAKELGIEAELDASLENRRKRKRKKV